MKDLKSICKIAVVQAAPVIFNKDACLEKSLKLIDEAATNGAEFVVFPELFIPGYPFGLTFGFTVGSRQEDGREDWKRYYDNSILIPGDETKALGAKAKEYGIYISMGVSERVLNTGTLYNTNLIFDPNGQLLSVHRKLKPTGSERVVWGDANNGYFPTVDSPWGVVGARICWETYMPLAMGALYEKGTALYISPNTNDNPEWQSTIQHVAIEGKCFFINADLYFTKDDYPDDLRRKHELDNSDHVLCRGGSCIIDPYGHYVTQPVWDKEAIIYADLEMDMVPMSRMEFDPCGHYARPDVLKFEFLDI